MFGWKPDLEKQPGEKPDWDAKMRLGDGPVPEEVGQLDTIISILDQKGNDCVINAGAQAIRADHVRQGVEDPELLARIWGYVLSRAQHNDLDVDEGTFIRMFFGAMNKLGFPRESEMPYEFDSLVDGKPIWSVLPPTSLFRAANDQQSPVAYRRIFSEGDDRILDIQRANSQRRCVVFGTGVTRKFVEGNFDIADPPGKNETIVGGHAMVFAGYSRDYVWGVNSWGINWCLGGWFKMSWEYVISALTRDLWIVEHTPVFQQAA